MTATNWKFQFSEAQTQFLIAAMKYLIDRSTISCTAYRTESIDRFAHERCIYAAQEILTYLESTTS